MEQLEETPDQAVELTALQAQAALTAPEQLAKSLRSRVIVRSDVIFQQVGRLTKVWGSPHGFDIETDEQPYERWQPVTEEWVKLNLAWIERPSVVYLHNPTPLFPVQPTDAQRQEAEGRIVEVAQSAGLNPFGLVRPGRDGHFEFTSEMYVRCRAGSVKLLVVALPS